MVAHDTFILPELWWSNMLLTSKDHVTLLACSNASRTHRLPLVFINKSTKPRCFKHMDMNNLPVHYNYSQKKSLMNCSIFSEWFCEKVFFNENGLENKAILLLDNAPSRPSLETLQSDNGKIKTLFLPSNTTATIQPMDQAVFDQLQKEAACPYHLGK